MRYRLAFTIAATLLFSSATMLAQTTSSSAEGPQRLRENYR